MLELHPRLKADLTQLRDRLVADGTLLSSPKTQRYYDLFRREFGPDILRALNGEQLLDKMHAHGSRESLVYWLEFKNDEEFPDLFGGIGGGSALKFGVYRRAETGAWARGERNLPKDIEVEEAIAIARKHRDELLAGVDALVRLPDSPSDRDYLKLQKDLSRVSPSVENTAWGHKYFALLFPEKLDDFHVEAYQKYHLARALQTPPVEGQEIAEGRYVSAGRFRAIAEALGVSLHEATTLLNRRNGRPVRYWRVGTTDGERSRRNFWPEMRDGRWVGIGWPDVGDLSRIASSRRLQESVKAKLRKAYPNTPQATGKAARQLLYFLNEIEPRHRVVAADGQTNLGVGEVTGDYYFDESSPFAHRRSVNWESEADWTMPVQEGLRTTVARIRDPRNRVLIERAILDANAPKVRITPDTRHSVPGTRTPFQSLPRLSGVGSTIQSVLERKAQAILYGPPGTGKTYWATRAAYDLASFRAFGEAFAELSDDQRARIDGTANQTPLVRLTSFHPEYGYEDFIEGFRPAVGVGGALAFTLVPGVFRRVCDDARAEPHLDFYLIIDEINRGDVPRIFGELLTLLEKDKRGVQMTLPTSREPFAVPSNVFVVGTMNTADRSIALLDVALRRRFGFVELMPDYDLLAGVSIEGIPIAAWLADLNDRIRRVGGGDARNRQIGHAFFLTPKGTVSSLGELVAVLRDDVVPLLEEYAYDDFAQLVDMLGPQLVDAAAQRVRRELFEPELTDALVSALLRPEIVTATSAVATDASVTEESVGAGDEEEDIET